MRGSFGSTDWRVSMTLLLIILFFATPLFLVAYQLGVHVRDHHYVPRITEDALREERNRAERKREVQWGAANCGENFEHALNEDQWWLIKELPESEEAAQKALSQIRAARLRSCHDLGYGELSGARHKP